MDLSRLSLQQLRALAEEVEAAIVEKTVSFDYFEFEEPDDRSMGHVEYDVKTPYGLLHVEAYVAEGHNDVQSMTLDGNSAHPYLDHVDIPNMNMNTKESLARKLCAESIEEANAMYKSSVKK